MQFQSFTIGAEESNERLDICLTKKTGLSRNFVQNLIKDGLVRVNKIQIEKILNENNIQINFGFNDNN